MNGWSDHGIVREEAAVDLPCPCAICDLPVTAQDVEDDDALFLLNGTVNTAAHVRHFFTDRGKTPTRDYRANLEKLATIHAVANGWLGRGKG